MCLLMTVFAALVFTVLWAVSKKQERECKSFRTTLLMFWAASLMWSVDGIASVLGGESFFDISVSDTILGTIVLVCGLVVFAFLFAKERRATKQSINAIK